MSSENDRDRYTPESLCAHIHINDSLFASFASHIACVPDWFAVESERRMVFMLYKHIHRRTLRSERTKRMPKKQTTKQN